MKRAVWGELHTPRLTPEHVLAVKVHVPPSSVKALCEKSKLALGYLLFCVLHVFSGSRFHSCDFFFLITKLAPVFHVPCALGLCLMGFWSGRVSEAL